MESFGKTQWVEMFEGIGLTDEKMRQWHEVFEAKYPEKHREFLEWLNIAPNEIESIRAKFRK